ncbi:DUF2891 family protein [Gryllotalpicola ginsengisoli]|uniref:DUF2891 family protein n=1 Tax=Gryllotalpicola ginsengisoli TaxID=444608 RepID=UPI0003B3E034|nr:DUF2891 family protein [Gryllotalpicola ginsengisoli]
MSEELQRAHADAFARVVLDNLSRPYPYAAHHTTAGPDDRPLPVELHPAFATSYDWHSCVHMTWLGTRLLEFGVAFPAADRLAGALQAALTAENLAVEADYLRAHPLFERPYGWGWALALAASAAGSDVPVVAALAPGFAPLTDVLVERVIGWLAAAPEPVRHGVHGNSAFGMRLALGAARELGRDDAAQAIEAAARRWFGEDRDWPFEYERSGQDFLSPGFAEADLMAAVLPPDEFGAWASGFFGRLSGEASVLTPATVLDPSDGQQVHLYGLGLSTSAAASRVARALRAAGGQDELIGWLEHAAPALLPAALEAAVSEEFMSSHWLATFAWDALEQLPG